MRKLLGCAFGALLIAGAYARGDAPAPAPAPTFTSAPAPATASAPATAPADDWSAFSRPFVDSAVPSGVAVAADPAPADVDVVDAYWMALTMWGEARSGGAEAMRAVGHVIDNRRRAGMHGRYATDQIGEAFQFSCWNPGDPNREKMLNVEALPAHSAERRLFETAKALANEILAGRSLDPTAGALFYHTAAVAPSWSRGQAPVRRIGGHLFFLQANRA